jgi:hypothetical protein
MLFPPQLAGQAFKLWPQRHMLRGSDSTAIDRGEAALNYLRQHTI